MKKIHTLLYAILISALFINSTIADQLPCQETLALAAINKTAYYLPESQALQLQKAINTYSQVRLKPGGDYRKSLTLKLTSNQALFGLSGTKLPAVIIAKGSKNTILSGVSPTQISFESGAPTQKNCINRINNSSIDATNASLEDNLFTDLSNVSIAADTSWQGYLKNNRFIRTMVHATSPAIRLFGDIKQKSTDNQFIWTNILTPNGDGIIVKNQKRLSFIGIDAESWNWSDKATYPAMLNVFNTEFLSVFMSSGGDPRHNTGQYFNLDANNILLQGMRISRTQKPGIILGGQVKSLVTIYAENIGLQKTNSASEVIDISLNGKPAISLNEAEKNPLGLTKNTIKSISNVLNIDGGINPNQNSPKPKSIADPVGPDWKTKIADQADSSSYIQNLINQNGIAELGPGIFYISKPLVLKNGQGIIGNGVDKTAIVALSQDIDLIQGGDHITGTTQITAFTLADLTLQGGRNGINHNGDGSGNRADYNQITLSHVTFRDMANAGILLDNIYAWDNNYIDHTQFYRCKVGIMQRPSPAYISGDSPGITFMDKNVFYQVQFVENQVAIDWQAKRGNNLNAFINCLFKNNYQAINLTNSDATFFANSLFETASDQPILVSNRLTGFYQSNFISNQSPGFLFKDNIYCNQCIFNNKKAKAKSIVSANSINSYFIKSTLSKPLKQPINTNEILISNLKDGKLPSFNSLFKNQIVLPF